MSEQNGGAGEPRPDGAEAIRIEGLRKSFGPNEVLKGVDLSVATHEVVCLIGASGSGKSTLLRCANLLETADAGTIWLWGSRVPGPGIDQNLVPSHLGPGFQPSNLFPPMTGRRHLPLPPVTVLHTPRPNAPG